MVSFSIILEIAMKEQVFEIKVNKTKRLRTKLKMALNETATAILISIIQKLQ